MQLPGQHVTINIVKVQSRYEDYKGMASRVLGGCQIALAVLSIAFNVAAIFLAYDFDFSIIGHGIWLPVFWIIAGGFGIAASYRKTPCTVISTMIMSILAASFMTVYIAMVSLQLVHFVVNENDDSWDSWKCQDEDTYYEDCGCFDTPDPDTGNMTMICVNCVAYEDYCTKSSGLIIPVLMMLVGVAEVIVAIAAAVLCCRVACCGSRKTTDVGPQNGNCVVVNTEQGPQAVALPHGYQVVSQASTEPAMVSHSKEKEAQTAGQNEPPPYNSFM